MIIIPIILVAVFLWILRYKLRDNFLRAYAAFFFVLLIFASNKALYGIPASISEGTFGPLSLIRWGLLGILCWQAWWMKKPAGFRPDIPLTTMLILLMSDMMISAVYADSFSYSFMRALSFALLAFALMRGLTFYLHSSVNCLHFFRFNYYIAWLVFAPFLLLYFAGMSSAVTVLMGQYAGFFGNQNMFGAVTALITPFVLFHWRNVAQKRFEKWMDLGLLAIMLIGSWLSGSRNGTTSCLLAIIVYFFVVNLQSRLKIVAAGIILITAFLVSPDLKTDLLRFVRKGTAESVQVTDFSSQVIEEKRFEMWTGVWPMFWKEKLTGYGFASSHLLVFPFTKDEEAGRALHNSYLEIFGDLGLPGLILLLILLYRIGTRAIIITRQRGEYLERNINAVFIAIFVAGSANAFFESWMFSVGNLISLMYWGPSFGIVARWARGTVEVRERSIYPETRPELRYTPVRAQH